MKQWFDFIIFILRFYFPEKENKMVDKDWDNLADLMDGTRNI